MQKQRQAAHVVYAGLSGGRAKRAMIHLPIKGTGSSLIRMVDARAISGDGRRRDNFRQAALDLWAGEREQKVLETADSELFSGRFDYRLSQS